MDKRLPLLSTTKTRTAGSPMLAVDAIDAVAAVCVNMPWRRYPFFVGRNFLELLLHTLAVKCTSPLINPLFHMHGQMALYVHRQRVNMPLLTLFTLYKIHQMNHSSRKPSPPPSSPSPLTPSLAADCHIDFHPPQTSTYRRSSPQAPFQRPLSRHKPPMQTKKAPPPLLPLSITSHSLSLTCFAPPWP